MLSAKVNAKGKTKAQDVSEGMEDLESVVNSKIIEICDALWEGIQQCDQELKEIARRKESLLAKREALLSKYRSLGGTL